MVHVLAALVWTPVTFYVAMGILHILAILIGFRLLHIDPENNTFVGAVIAGVVINVIAYFVRDLGVVSVMIQLVVVFGMLVMVASGEAFKGLLMSAILLGSYGAVATFVIPRTPLDQRQIGGFAEVILEGGLKQSALTEGDVKNLNENGVPMLKKDGPDTP